ncbi:MAG: LysR family transcriptional regulator [Proteobacteria bacterium]|nr:LysR family transcriptional regulator [Pseudomonadota bacterium]
MDWRSVQFDWNRARAFLVTVEEGSYSAAARALGTSQPTIGRQVAALERELDVLLFERVGTRLELTATGLDLVEHVRAMGEAATKVSLVATGQSTSLEGTVTVTASEAIAAHLLPPILAELRIEQPGIEIELVVSNAPRDLSRREADIAIRNFRPDQADLIARRVRDSVGHLYAAPAYLARIGPITSVSDLTRAEFFAFDRTALMVDGFARMGVTVTRAQFPIVTSNHLVQWAMCKQGMGIAVMMKQVGDAEPGVECVLRDVVMPVPIWLVCHRELRTSPRIRLVFDRLAAGLA